MPKPHFSFHKTQPELYQPARNGDHIRAIDEEPPLNLDEYDFELKDPQTYKRELGHAAQHFQATETGIPLYSKKATTWMPNLEPHLLRFTTVQWPGHELIHGEGLGRFNDIAGIERIYHDPGKMGPGILLTSPLDHIQEFHDTFVFSYLTTGKVQERTTMEGYKFYRRRARALGESALEKFLAAVHRQEPFHYNYYDAEAEERNRRLRLWQRWIGRTLTNSFIDLVGVENNTDRIRMGRTIRQLRPDNLEAIAYPVDKVRMETLAAPKSVVEPPFIGDRIISLLRSGNGPAPNNIIMKRLIDAVEAAREADDKDRLAV